MNNIVFNFINDSREKKKIVSDFADSYYNRNLGAESLARLADKISHYAVVMTANTDGETAGFTAYYRNDVLSGTAYITIVVLKKRFRGRGLGTAMIKKVIEDCIANGFKAIRLEVDNTNQAALNLYTKLDFKKEKESEGSSSYYLLTL